MDNLLRISIVQRRTWALERTTPLFPNPIVLDRKQAHLLFIY